MKKLLLFSAGAALVPMLVMVLTAHADGPRPKRGNVVVPEPAGYTLNANWVTGISQDGGSKGQSIKLGDGGDFSYYAFQGWWDHNLTDVKKIRASFLAGPGTLNSGGSPRFSLEVRNADGTQRCIGVCDGTNPVAIFLDPALCGDPAASGGGWIEADFTGDRTNCMITDNVGHTYTSDATGTAWSKLTADPYYAGAGVWFLYAIQDATVGSNYIDRIMLDSAFLTKAP